MTWVCPAPDPPSCISAPNGVGRVVDQVCNDLGDVGHVEVDMEANPGAARRFSVLSLPTTLIFDVDGRLRYRTSGVPKAADLRSALEPLLA
jgi:thioredoxin-like negative regulator of GroEL